jgi:hypothetical protein
MVVGDLYKPLNVGYIFCRYAGYINELRFGMSKFGLKKQY